jgi:hypothetical protein
VAAEAAREDPRCLDRRRLAEIRRDHERPDRDAPTPTVAGRIVFGIADQLDDGEDRLPARRVADREISLLEAWTPRGGMRLQRGRIDVSGKGSVARAANEKPVLHDSRRFLTGRAYAREIRTLVVACLVAAALLALSGCGDSGDGSTPAVEPTATTTTVSTTETTEGIDPLEGAGTDPVEGDGTGGETALLERVALGRHEGYDRVVFQFRNGLPGYRVEYVAPPLKEDGSGNVVKVQGSAFVVVRMEPASGFDLTTGEGVMVYKGPKRIDGTAAGTSVVREVVRTGDFEAVLSWAVGLEERVDFRVRTTTSPARLIVDFRNH